jgi:hypothetical protein
MIGFTILVVIALYWWLASTIVGKVYAKTQSLTKKRIAIAIFILIPTWDVILGFPIYAYLCMTQSGTKIYKTVDNVEGFYVGKLDSNHPYPPRQGYRYMDYKDEKSGKYYRNYWLDNNTSELCIPVGIYRYSDYAKAFKEGKCIGKKEIKESEVSRWDTSNQINNDTTLVPYYLEKWTVKIMDKSTGKPLAELINYHYGQGWVAIVFSSLVQYARWTKCSLQKSYQDVLLETLKPKKQEEK